jgi:LCP family protein required for cell wall assembly
VAVPTHRRGAGLLTAATATRSRRAGAVTAATLLVVVLLVVADALVLTGRVPRLDVAPSGSGAGKTYLLVASDSRERLDAADRTRYADANQPSGERADLVILLRAPEAGPARLYSVPRDLYVGEQRKAPHRLGLALADGPQALVDSLCTDVGVGVDHVVVADFEALVGLVDTVGGISVTVAEPTRDRRAQLDVPGGTQRLDGRQALAWVRSRHPQVLRAGKWVADPAADPTRSTHAAQVLRGVSAALDDPVTVQRALWAAGPSLRRDAGLGVPQLLGLARALRGAAAAGVVTVPAQLEDTTVPFAFVTDATTAALRPLRSPGCTAG